VGEHRTEHRHRIHEGPVAALDSRGANRADSVPVEDLGEVIMDYENDTVGGYAVPVDPMDLLQCDSCQ